MKKIDLYTGLLTTAAFFVVALIFIIPDSAWAHAYPDHADPKVGSTIRSSPPLVRIWFDSELEPAFSTITVQNSSGGRVDAGDFRVDPSDQTLLEVSLPPLPPGVYRVFWNVVARDTHRTTGDYTFTIK